jgi:F-type H+-transporting ATPase subunit epsilon
VSGFTLELHDATRSEEIPGVTSFVGEDDSGSFGILPDHTRFMTSLVIGLARFRVGDGPWQYLAMPGALLYFRDNRLALTTRHYLRDDDYLRISSALTEQLLAEEAQLRDMKQTLRHMEEDILRRLWEMSRAGTELGG